VDALKSITGIVARAVWQQVKASGASVIANAVEGSEASASYNAELSIQVAYEYDGTSWKMYADETFADVVIFNEIEISATIPGTGGILVNNADGIKFSLAMANKLVEALQSSTVDAVESSVNAAQLNTG
jgi:hypothetical protein